VETLTLISTDKAVHPTSVMGASKRVCEMLLQGMSGSSRTTMVAVRFGNVIGSAGSVLPIFRQQLTRGGPLTVTHPEARRYFMTIPEASQLVIQAALNGQSGDVFILDMGEPVRILDVARQLIRLNGLEPDRDIRIEFIGLRPGEKLEEEIFTDLERARATRHSKIFRCELEEVKPEWIETEIAKLARVAESSESQEIRAALRSIVPDYREVSPAPLPETVTSGEEPALAATAPVIQEAVSKRALDVVSAVMSLTLLVIPAAFAWVLVNWSGAATVKFVAERRLGSNRRRVDRRSDGQRVGIDRRDGERRKRVLPGRPFVTYRIIVERPTASNAFQRRLAAGLSAARLDRVLYLWNVLRGDMSLVGPSAHLLESDSWKQSEVSAWCFARRPGLTGPAQILGGGEETPLYDGYYAKHANWKLDLDALRLSLPRLLRPSTRRRPEEDSGPTEVTMPLPRSTASKGGIP
jgi:lipopolysaccharide/colanic/teichoic acid biosynthesis glycosyltransferase